MRRLGPGRFDLLEQEIDKDLLMLPVQGRGGLVGNDDFRLADQRPCGRHPLLLSDRERAGRAPVQGFGEAQTGEQATGFGRRTAAPRRLAPAAAREIQWQQDVVQDRPIGQEVEHLKDDAEMIGSEAVARAALQAGKIGSQHLDLAALRPQDAANEAQQGALAAARVPP